MIIKKKNNIILTTASIFTVSILLVTVVALSAASKDIVFETFEGSYAKWTATGNAFTDAPNTISEGTENGLGEGVTGDQFVSSYMQSRDRGTGTLLSKKFKISRKYVVFYMSGGVQEELGCRVVVNKKIVATQSPEEKGNTLYAYYLDVSKYKGKTARIEIFDEADGSWGQLSLDHIIFTDNYKKYVKY